MKPRLLIIGCGDVVSRALPWLQKRFRIYVLKHHASFAPRKGVTAVAGDLDDITTLSRLKGLAQYIIYAAPPAQSSQRDRRVWNLIKVLLHHGSAKSDAILTQSLRHVVYISTSGVYGDCQGAWIDEARPPKPESDRACSRWDAEKKWRKLAQSQKIGLTILRVPGIYAHNRLPLTFLQAQTPVMVKAEDSFSNHIHADDLAHIINIALFRAARLRVYHASDACPMKMGEYFTLLAKHLALPIPIQLSREQVKEKVSLGLWSFMRESRRLDNSRLEKELRIRLRYPSVREFLKTI